jgi:hypothetical protein
MWRSERVTLLKKDDAWSSLINKLAVNRHCNYCIEKLIILFSKLPLIMREKYFC